MPAGGQADLLRQFGRLYIDAGLWADAERCLRAASADRPLVELYARLGRPAEARAAYARTAATVDAERLGPERGLCLMADGSAAEARRVLADYVRDLRGKTDTGPLYLARTVHALADATARSGDPAAARALYLEVARLAEAGAGPDHPRVADALDAACRLDPALAPAYRVRRIRAVQAANAPRGFRAATGADPGGP